MNPEEIAVIVPYAREGKIKLVQLAKRDERPNGAIPLPTDEDARIASGRWHAVPACEEFPPEVQAALRAMKLPEEVDIIWNALHCKAQTVICVRKMDWKLGHAPFVTACSKCGHQVVIMDKGKMAMTPVCMQCHSGPMPIQPDKEAQRTVDMFIQRFVQNN